MRNHSKLLCLVALIATSIALQARAAEEASDEGEDESPSVAVSDASSKKKAVDTGELEKTPPSLTPTAAVDAEDKPSLSAPEVDSKRQKFLSLYIGIEQQEGLPYLPPRAEFRGDFKKVVKVEVNKETGVLLFKPQTEGLATLTVHDSKGRKIYEFRVDVRRSDLTKVANEMRSLLNDIEGVTIKIVNNKVVVDGQVLLPRDLSRIISVVLQFPDKASSLVSLSPLAQRKIAAAIVVDINNPEISVRPVNDKFILEGLADSDDEKNRAESIAQVYVPDVVKEAGEKDGTIVKLKKSFVLNFIKVKPPAAPNPGKTIQLVVHYVELNKDYEKSFRFQFTPTIDDKSSVSFANDSRSPGSVISSITGIVSNLLPKLNNAKSHGHARVLKSSTLIVLDGQKGELKNTTKIPYSTINSQGQSSTSFEEAGFIANITPQILNARSDSIRLAMDFQLKNLLGVTDKGPMVSNNSMVTTIIVRSSQSAAVGGLISNSNSTDYNKLPKANATDPLISLYASKSFQRQQSQFVVFVTPIIKLSASHGSEKIKKKFNVRD